jgi:hypothetical protein
LRLYKSKRWSFGEFATVALSFWFSSNSVQSRSWK